MTETKHRMKFDTTTQLEISRHPDIGGKFKKEWSKLHEQDHTQKALLTARFSLRIKMRNWLRGQLSEYKPLATKKSILKSINRNSNRCQ